MNLLKEQMLKYAGCLTENLTPEQLGNKLFQLKQNSNEQDLLKIINTLCRKDWVHTVFSKDTITISLNPMNWNKADGNINDCMAVNHPEEALYFKELLSKWLKSVSKELKTQYPNYKIIAVI